MDAFAIALIDGMGGPPDVSRFTKSPISTVHSWRRVGLSHSRIDHLRRVIADEGLSVDVEALAALHGVTLPVSAGQSAGSPGTIAEVSAEVSA